MHTSAPDRFHHGRDREWTDYQCPVFLPETWGILWFYRSEGRVDQIENTRLLHRVDKYAGELGFA